MFWEFDHHRRSKETSCTEVTHRAVKTKPIRQIANVPYSAGVPLAHTHMSNHLSRPQAHLFYSGAPLQHPSGLWRANLKREAPIAVRREQLVETLAANHINSYKGL